jgi:hypothetical protein
MIFHHQRFFIRTKFVLPFFLCKRTHCWIGKKLHLGWLSLKYSTGNSLFIHSIHAQTVFNNSYFSYENLDMRTFCWSLSCCKNKRKWHVDDIATKTNVSVKKEQEKDFRFVCHSFYSYFFCLSNSLFAICSCQMYEYFGLSRILPKLTLGFTGVVFH